MMIAFSYFFQGKLAEAREPAEEAFRVAPWEPVAVGFLAGLLARAGEKDRAEKLIATIQRPDRHDDVSPDLLGDRRRDRLVSTGH